MQATREEVEIGDTLEKKIWEALTQQSYKSESLMMVGISRDRRRHSANLEEGPTRLLLVSQKKCHEAGSKDMEESKKLEQTATTEVRICGWNEIDRSSRHLEEENAFSLQLYFNFFSNLHWWTKQENSWQRRNVVCRAPHSTELENNT